MSGDKESSVCETGGYRTAFIDVLIVGVLRWASYFCWLRSSLSGCCCVCVWVGFCACGIAAMGALEDCFACLLVKRNKHCDVLDILLSLLFSPRASVRSLVTH